MATLEQMQAALDLEVATEFLLIAAVLLELKARRLLPGRDDVELEEEIALWEERDLLLARLLECKTFKDAAGDHAPHHGLAARSWPRVAGLDERFADLAPDLLGASRPSGSARVMQALLQPKPQTGVLLDHVAPVRASVRDAVDELAVELPGAGRISFSRLTSRTDRAAGDDRPVPGSSRAVQAGSGGAGAGRIVRPSCYVRAGSRRPRRRSALTVEEYRG